MAIITRMITIVWAVMFGMLGVFTYAQPCLAEQRAVVPLRLSFAGMSPGFGNQRDFLRINRGNPVAAVLLGEFENISTASFTLMPDKVVNVLLEYGKLSVGKGSIVHVSDWGSGVAIYDLHDSRRGDVSVSGGKEKIVLHPGMMVVLSKERLNNDRAMPAGLRRIGIRNGVTHSLSSGAFIYDAEFSMASAITNIENLKGLCQSAYPEDRKLRDSVLKTAACLSIATASHGPYQSMGR